MKEFEFSCKTCITIYSTAEQQVLSPFWISGIMKIFNAFGRKTRHPSDSSGRMIDKC